jgi:hypothetical protein
MAERSTWRGFHPKADQQPPSAPEVSMQINRRTSGIPESMSEIRPVSKRNTKALLPSRRGTRSSPSLLISSVDRFHTSPIDSGMF